MKLILTICLLLGANIDDYKQYFENGLAAYNKRQYQTAIENFSKSYVLKKHSKLSYYIAISYFKIGNDSLANIFALRAENEAPKLSDEPYQQNIKHIYYVYNLPPVLKKIKFDVTLSNNDNTIKQKKDEKKIKQEFNLYYPNTPEGQQRFFSDLKLSKDRSLVWENELNLNMTTGKYYQNPIIDSLDN